MRSLLPAAAAATVVLLLAPSPARADDPADSWLVYGQANSTGRILHANATWAVPAYPTTRAGGNAPGWWFGIEPTPADVLIQPILAYGDGSPAYTIFTGFYDWHDGNWVQSATQDVTPGTKLLGSIDWDAATETYRQCIQVVGSGKPICTRVSKANTHGELFNQIFFVVEHQPNSCGEYPANGAVTFENINVVWQDGKVLTPADWTIAQFKPACNSQGKVLSASSLEFTWSTSDE